MSAASDLLALYLAAEAKILAGQEATLGDRRLKLADLAEVRAERQNLERRVEAENRAAAGSVGARHQLADFS
jgi:hypothetical protein